MQLGAVPENLFRQNGLIFPLETELNNVNMSEFVLKRLVLYFQGLIPEFLSGIRHNNFVLAKYKEHVLVLFLAFITTFTPNT